MNKTQLVDALAAKLGDRKSAATAVDGVLDTIVETVTAGDSVSITGFGVFEPRARAARVARNPRTGEAVDVAATTVPAFRAGAGFRSAVSGTASTPAPRATPTRSRTAAATAAPAKRTATKAKGFAAEPAAEKAVPEKAVPEKAVSDKAAKPAKARTAKAAKAPAKETAGKDAGKAKKAKPKK